MPFGQRHSGIISELPVGAGNRYGIRKDGTPKGLGYLGPLQRPDGRVSTELSIGVNFDNQDRLIPLLVPTLEPGEVKYLLEGGVPGRDLLKKAVEHARDRISKGMSPFKD